ncbi:hypothetical protein [Xenorhabdus sp. KK7.4]|nr:hypothetical protein [Xenorhabdus sp. KK7.4]
MLKRLERSLANDGVSIS